MLRLKTAILFAATLFLASSCASISCASSWIGGVGDWFDTANWNAGVPNPLVEARINQGGATFAAPAAALTTVIANTDSLSRVLQANANVIGTADFSAGSLLAIATADGTGRGTARTAAGALTITGGDLLLSNPPASRFDPSPKSTLVIGSASGTGTDTRFTASGSLIIEDGSIFNAGSIGVGFASGTGTRSRFDVSGVATIRNGSVEAKASVSVGVAGGTGTESYKNAMGRLSVLGGGFTAVGGVRVGLTSGTGNSLEVADGEMLVVGGDVIISPPPPSGLDPSIFVPKSVLAVGNSYPIATATGDAVGVFTLQDGDLYVDEVTLGVSFSTEYARSSAEGTLRITDGDLLMESLTVSSVEGVNATAMGRYEHYRGVATGRNLQVGRTGRVVLGVGGTIAGEEYATIRIETAQVNGVIEAVFEAGFEPQLGDQFVLMEADSISGDYQLAVTGLALPNGASLQVSRSSTQLSLVIVPEPSLSYLLLNVAAVASGRRASAVDPRAHRRNLAR